MTAPPDRVRQAAATAVLIGLLVPLAAVLLSVMVSPATNWTVRVATGAFCILAIGRPDAALLVTTALVGFGVILSHLAGAPSLRVSELLVVGSVAGCFIRALAPGSRLRRGLGGSIDVPIVLFAAVVVASTIVWVWVYQARTGYAAAYLSALFESVSRNYFFERSEFSLVVTAAALLEGLALYVVAGAMCRADPSFSPRALRMLALGGAGLGVMSAVRLGEILLRNPSALEALRATPSGLRISPQIPDYIAAGSYFALCWLVSLGLALTSSRRRLWWLAAGVPLIAALYLTGSRSVIGAALAGVLVLVVIAGGRRAAAARGMVAFVAAGFVLMIVTYPWLIGRDVLGATAKTSMTIRLELAQTGVRVIETRPLFGVGLERYHLIAGGLASPELNALWPGRKNPHNDFIRIGAELGLVGLGAFLWILGAAGLRIRRALQASRDLRIASLCGGLVAVLITSLVSDPLGVREVSYVFWIALAIAAAHLPETQPSRATAPRWTSTPAKPVLWTGAAVIGVLLFAAVPSRARQELRDTDLSRVTYGLYDWSVEPDGTMARWSGARVRLFVDARARLVEIPLSGTLPSGLPQEVEIRVDGRLANRVSVGREWQRLRTILPPHASSSAREIDLVISPTWVPAEVLPANQDRRILGVKVGKIGVITDPERAR